MDLFLYDRNFSKTLLCALLFMDIYFSEIQCRAGLDSSYLIFTQPEYAKHLSEGQRVT